MRNRLLGINPLLAAAGLLGLLAAAALYSRGLGVPLPPYQLSAGEIIEKAREHVRLLHHPAADSMAVAATRREDFGSVAGKVGWAEARRLVLSEELPITTWHVRFRGSMFFSSMVTAPAPAPLHDVMGTWSSSHTGMSKQGCSGAVVMRVS